MLKFSRVETPLEENKRYDIDINTGVAATFRRRSGKGSVRDEEERSSVGRKSTGSATRVSFTKACVIVLFFLNDIVQIVKML